ncbi:MAG: endonuclease/exonuclease/phosphatase family protein [Bacteroidales bacterium]|nr:endonuclease/exonuclease/phosphatase family protein [Bacteroidales bacterium]
MSEPYRILSVLVIIILTLEGCRKTPEPPDPGQQVDFTACVKAGESSSFEIMSFNLQGFPKTGSLTIHTVRDLINAADPDIIALQELINESDFDELLEEMPGWDGRFNPGNNDEWNLAFLFKESEVSIDDSKTRIIYDDDTYAFPRPPFEIFVTHRTLKQSAYLINIHLKCCSGAENEARRRDAAVKLNEFIQNSRSGDPVIILGDFNDIISGENSAENQFYIFVAARAEYRFTDMHIAKGSLLWWSYPSWPSHIDHILVTNELFQRIDTTVVLKAEPCYPDFFENISDHRPVELILK